MNIIEIMKRWPNQEAAIAHLEKVRWNGKPVCPYCNSDKVCVHASKDKSLPRWQCEDCHSAFSVTVGTIFHHTHLPLQTWFLAMAIMLNAKKNVSNAQLARDLNLPYKTAWSLALRIRTAMVTDPAQKELFKGIVEMDETYVGGKPRKTNKQEDNKPSKRGRGTEKTPVVGMVERNGKVKIKVIADRNLTQRALNAIIQSSVDTTTATLVTDEYVGYAGVFKFMKHFVINHKVQFSKNGVNTNTIEGFWALVKRSWYGQHHHYSDKWAGHYISETAFKYNNRKNQNVFSDLMSHMVGVLA
ncbi:MAG: IS1595 family transposase [Chloroflexota bacterium]|nr:IS1595 family transposase [Chloroflexota bacterium]